MRTDHSMKSKSSSWSKSAVGKWLNRKSNSEKFFHSSGGTTVTDTADRRKSFSDQDNNYGDDDDFSGWLKYSTNGLKQSELKEKERGPMADPLNLRMFVGTWNVGGKSPNESLDLRNWLTSTSPADIYVIGFQEIVPLNAGNVLGPEDSGPAGRWVSLIHEALNNKNIDDDDDEDKKRRWLYCQVACKQMVGIFLSVWVRHPHCAHLTNLNTSCVGRGIMGYLGNKGSISISMTLHKATFCFVCTHLASGEKSGDELRRNLDVSEILKRTKFYNSSLSVKVKLVTPPQSILEHDNVIWLGDLNYRLAADYDHIHHLLINNNWQTLLEKDQLRKEQKGGGIFEGWNEGSIYFAPTYKYLTNSDQYVAQTSKSKEKRRTPAWCDRILWKGEEVNQMWYVRGESKFSDHRPVSSMFSLQVDLTSSSSSSSSITSVPRSSCSQLKPLTSTCCAAKIQAEEQLMLLTRTQSCIATATRLLT